MDIKEIFYYIGSIKDIFGITIESKIIFTLTIITIILFILNLFKKNFHIISFLTLPGTFLHELSHYILSLILNGKPVSFTIFPKKKDIYNEYGEKIGYSATLGSVGSKNIRWYNGLWISIAPLLLYPLAFYLIYLTESINNEIILYLTIYLIANLLNSGFPSSQDWKVAWQSSKWVILLFLFIVIIITVIEIIFKINILKIIN